MRFLKLVACVLAAAAALCFVLITAYFTWVAWLWMRANASRDDEVAPAGGSSRRSAA